MARTKDSHDTSAHAEKIRAQGRDLLDPTEAMIADLGMTGKSNGSGDTSESSENMEKHFMPSQSRAAEE